MFDLAPVSSHEVPGQRVTCHITGHTADDAIGFQLRYLGPVQSVVQVSVGWQDLVTLVLHSLGVTGSVLTC